MISDFSMTQMETVKNALAERWADKIELHIADVEVRIYPDDRELTLCPAVVWEVEECNFVLIKINEDEYKNVFYYRGSKQFGTGIDKYDNLESCVKTLLQVQADFLASELNNEQNT